MTSMPASRVRRTLFKVLPLLLADAQAHLLFIAAMAWATSLNA
jgi:hypothetical protein